MLIGTSTSLEDLEGSRASAGPAPIADTWPGALSRWADRLRGVASRRGVIEVRRSLAAHQYDLRALVPAAAVDHSAPDSYLRYTEYLSRPFLIAEGRGVITALHSKAIAIPERGLVDEFNVGGGGGVPDYLLSQDFEVRDGGLHAPESGIHKQPGFSVPLCHYGIGTFGHFILDALLQVYMFRRELAADARALHWPLPEPWMGPLLDRCGAGRRHEATARLVHMDRAGLSSALAGHGVYFPGPWSIGFFDWLRARMDVPPTSERQRLFVRRSNAYRRTIHNAVDLEALAVAHRFTVISPEDYPLRDQMRMFASAGVVMSPWGSTLTLAPLLGGSRCVVELLPSSVRDTWFPRQAVVHGLDYRPLLQSSDDDGGMQIDLVALETLLRALPS